MISPIIVYMAIVSLLSNNYIKAYRKEKVLLYINVLAVILAVGLYGISAYLIENLSLLLFTVLLVIMIRSIASELYVMKLIHINLKKEFVIELLMTSAFLFSTQYLDRWTGFLFYFTFLMGYSYYKRDNIKKVLLQMFVQLFSKL